MDPHLQPSVVLTAFVLLLTPLVLVWYKVETHTGHSDPYGLFHLTLNRLPSQDPSSPPETEWLNMGYWKVCACPYWHLFFDERMLFLAR